MELLQKLKTNPSNPRTIKKEEFECLKNKIKAFPEMLEKRPIVYDREIVLGGNQRLQVLKDLVKEWSDLPLDEWGIDTSGWDSGEVEEDEAPEVSDEPAISKLG